MRPDKATKMYNVSPPAPSLFDRFAKVIADIPMGKFWTDDYPDERLLIDTEPQRGVRIYYAPFDYVNKAASIAIVGITPGKTQMLAALEEAKRQLAAGADFTASARAAKNHASFSGPMRDRLVEQLDHFRINEYLRLSTCASLFTTHSHLAHFTSSLRYPVFVDKRKKGNPVLCENYTGSSPSIHNQSVLMRYLHSYFAAELRTIPRAVIVPLGAAMHNVCRLLASSGHIDPDRLLLGIEHPSGGSNGNSGYLMYPKPRGNYGMRSSIPFDRIDDNRQGLRDRIERLLSERHDMDE